MPVIPAMTEEELSQAESIIERGQKTFVEVGKALMQIREGKGYRLRGYATFEAYCKEHLRLSTRQGYYLMAGAEAVENVQTFAQSEPTYSQAVQLSRLEPEQQREVASQVDFSQVTTRELREIVTETTAPLSRQAQTGPATHAAPETRSNTAPLMTSESNEWYTPTHIIERVLKVLGEINLDPCSNSKATPNVPALMHYTKEDDGLCRAWQGAVYMNPPYGEVIGQWIAKLVAAHGAENVTEAIALVPARTDTRWFQLLRDFPLCFIRGRLRFSDADNSATFPSVVVYMGPNLSRFANAFMDLGDIYVRYKHGNA